MYLDRSVTYVPGLYREPSARHSRVRSRTGCNGARGRIGPAEPTRVHPRSNVALHQTGDRRIARFARSI